MIVKPFTEKQLEEYYRRDENMMILVFAQWCVNHDLDPMVIYSKAYPGQPLNKELRKTAEELVVPKEESEPIPDQTVIGVLEMFGNSDLAEAVYEAIAQRPSR
ncbi:hypothetical protein [Bacillus velezensis]|uniref:hypothetical protein n=2 Tax=Bacillus velezensis TaxID=492670 RepID=UPI00288A29A1|nr:hypothetical protein [Bacillus velezensis]WNJ15551.1 hypothetical protein RJY17_10105 [Bacillus velezensis]